MAIKSPALPKASIQNHLIFCPCHKLKTIESEHESLDSITKHTRTLKSLIYMLMAFLLELDPKPHTFQLRIIKKNSIKPCTEA